MAAIVNPGDFTPFATIEPATKLAAMIQDAEAMAALAAPCITEPEFQAIPERVAQVAAIIKGAILRWNEAGTGAKIAQNAGPFQTTLDTTNQRRGMYWPSELVQLREVCAQYRNAGKRTVFAVDTAPGLPPVGVHAPWCSVYFGVNGYMRPPYVTTCSCGSDLNNYLGPIYEEPTP